MKNLLKSGIISYCLTMGLMFGVAACRPSTVARANSGGLDGIVLDQRKVYLRFYSTEKSGKISKSPIFIVSPEDQLLDSHAGFKYDSNGISIFGERYLFGTDQDQLVLVDLKAGITRNITVNPSQFKKIFEAAEMKDVKRVQAFLDEILKKAG